MTFWKLLPCKMVQSWCLDIRCHQRIDLFQKEIIQFCLLKLDKFLSKNCWYGKQKNPKINLRFQKVEKYETRERIFKNAKDNYHMKLKVPQSLGVAAENRNQKAHLWKKNPLRLIFLGPCVKGVRNGTHESAILLILLA